MNDYVEWYLICGVAYATMEEYKHRKSLGDDEDYWWFGELVSTAVFGVYHTLFWFKCIADDMLAAYFNNDKDDGEV